MPITTMAGLPAASQLALLYSAISAGNVVRRLVPTFLPHRSVISLKSLFFCKV
ncbi:hypothetical protein D3C85_1889030 [compost metagenome]